jgi:hypothetical protein
MYESQFASIRRRIAVTGRSDQYANFASQHAMKASACAVFSTAKCRAELSVERPAHSTRSAAIVFQWPGGVVIPAPSAQKSAIRFCSAVSGCETAYTSFISARNRRLP